MFEYLKSLGYKPIAFFGVTNLLCHICHKGYMTIYSVDNNRRIWICTLSANDDKYPGRRLPGCGNTNKIIAIRS